METLLIVTFSISFLITLLLIFLFFHHHRPNTLPPGRTGLPFIGETLRMFSCYKTENPEQFIDDRIERFGLIFKSHLFGEPAIYSVDPEVNRFILNNEGKLFESDYPNMIAYLHGEHSLLLMKGKLHKKMHSLAVNFINTALVRGHLLHDVNRLMRFYMDSWSPKVVLWEETKKITFALTMKLLLGVDPCEWTESIKKEFLFIVNGFWSIPLPFFSMSYRRAVKAKAKVVRELSLVVSKRRRAREEGETKDMLGAILEERADDGLTDEMIVDLLVSFLLAGFETSSSAMTLAVKFLTEAPLALAQLKDEQEKIRSEKGANDPVIWNDYKSGMPFTQCVISETLRIANIVGTIFRRTISDIQLNDYIIPKGWKIIVAARGVHLREENFEDARSFNPWRWQGNQGANLSNVVIPFGGGPRLCPGYEFSKVSLSVFLHYLVTNYRWETAEKDKLIFFPMIGTQKGYPIFVHHRNPST